MVLSSCYRAQNPLTLYCWERGRTNGHTHTLGTGGRGSSNIKRQARTHHGAHLLKSSDLGVNHIALGDWQYWESDLAQVT